MTTDILKKLNIAATSADMASVQHKLFSMYNLKELEPLLGGLASNTNPGTADITPAILALLTNTTLNKYATGYCNNFDPGSDISDCLNDTVKDAMKIFQDVQTGISIIEFIADAA